jgi:flagellar biosynthetic protein FliP
MTTAFTRIIVVLSFLRQGLGTQQVPPNQVLIGLAMFLTFFVMQPTFTKVQTDALTPYMNGKLPAQEALKKARSPSVSSCSNKCARKISPSSWLCPVPAAPAPGGCLDITLIPAFVISELRRAFEMGFLIFIPFLIIDMVVASVLMSMGMLMLPPVMISLPFKILLFILVDGWNLIVRSLALSF